MSRRSGPVLPGNTVSHVVLNHRIGLSLILLILCSGFVSPVYAYSLPWTWFTRQNGLPENPVRQVLEDQEGRLLVLTYNEGLFFYDGRQFLPHPANTQLPSLFIQTVLLDQQGRLWIACNYRGIWIYENGRVRAFSENGLFHNQHFTCLYGDSQNRIWTYVNRVGLFLIEERATTHLTTQFSLPLEDIVAIQEAQGVFYLLSTQGALQTLDLRHALFADVKKVSSSRLVHFLFTRDGTLLTLEADRGLVQYGKNGSEILLAFKMDASFGNRLFEDAQGMIWFSQLDHLCRYDRHSKRFTNYPLMEGSALFEDRFHHLWFPTRQGLATAPNPLFRFFDLPVGDAPPPLEGNQWGNTFYYVDRRGIHWFFNQNSELIRFDGHRARLFSWPDSLGFRQSTAMIQDAHGSYWFAGAHRDLLRWDGKTFSRPIPRAQLPAAYLTSLCMDAENRLWISGISSFITFATPKSSHLLDVKFYRTKTPTLDSAFSSVHVDAQGTVWLADCSHSIFHAEQNRFRRLAELPMNKIGQEEIHHLWHDEKGLWGTNSNRIVNLDFSRNGSKAQISYYPLAFSPALPALAQFSWPAGPYRQSDLPFDIPAFSHYKNPADKRIYHISAMLPDSLSLWLASYSVGLIYVNSDTVIRYGAKHGLPSLRVSALLRDHDGRLWVGTLDQGLFEFRQGRFYQTDRTAAIGHSIYALAVDNRGRLWIATLDNGLASLHRGEVRGYNQGLPHPAVWGIGFGAKGQVYAALNDNRFAELVHDRFVIHPSTALLANPDLRSAFQNQTIDYRRYLLDYPSYVSSGLVSWDGKKLTTYTVEDGLAGHDITDMAVGADGSLYAATFNCGICRYKNGKFETLQDSTVSRLHANMRMEPTADSSLWVLTQDEGLAKIRGEQARQWSDDSNLSSFHLSDLHKSGQNLLLTDASRFYYFSSDRLHDQYVPAPDVSGNRLSPFFHLDSLQQLSYVAADNKLYQLSLRTPPPVISLTRCQIENEVLDESTWRWPIEREFRDRVMVLEFFGYHADFPSRSMTYSYRVMAASTPGEWQKTASSRLIYTQLHPGTTQVFEIRSHAPNGTVSEPIRLVIRTAAQPVYLRTWFFWSAVTLGLMGVAGVFIYRYYRIRDLLFRRRFNPYIAGEPVVKPEMFYGREETLRRILGVIHNNNMMILGERRIGKTSLLLHLKKELARPEPQFTFLPVYIDLQGVVEEEFFYSVMHDILEGAQGATGSLDLCFHRGQTYAYREFSRDLRRLIEHLAASCRNTFKLTLLIDEADVMNSYDQIIHAQLRRVFMLDLSHHLAAVITGTHFIRRWNRPESPWWNMFTLMDLGALSRASAQALIQAPVKGLFRYDQEAIDEIIALTECKPYLIQMICLQLVNVALDDRKRSISKQDVVQVVQQYALFKQVAEENRDSTLGSIG